MGIPRTLISLTPAVSIRLYPVGVVPLILVAAGLTGCVGSSGGGGGCLAGAIWDCECDDGTPGQRTCGPDHIASACRCESAASDDGGGAGQRFPQRQGDAQAGSVDADQSASGGAGGGGGPGGGEGGGSDGGGEGVLESRNPCNEPLITSFVERVTDPNGDLYAFCADGALANDEELCRDACAPAVRECAISYTSMADFGACQALCRFSSILRDDFPCAARADDCETALACRAL